MLSSAKEGLSLQGQRALVTGGNGGIGAAVSSSLAQQAASVIISHVRRHQRVIGQRRP